MVLDAGIEYIIGLLSTKFTKIAVGTGNSPVTGSETSLTNQVAKDIQTVDNQGDGYVQFNSELVGSDPAMQIQEMGLINENGQLMYRQVISPQNKVAGVTYSINYKIRIQ